MNNRAIQQLTLQLQKSLDSNYDVVDMQSVLFVIQQLENTTITKEQLETTRLAKYINELRRRTTSDTLARRAKSLLKKWRDIFMPAIQQQSVCIPPAVPPSTPPVTVRNAGEVGGVGGSSHSQTTRSQAATMATSSQNKHASIVANNLTSISTNKISTGSANNNNTSSKQSSSLSNGGFQKQHHSGLFASEARVDSLRPRGSRTVSPIVSTAACSSSLKVDRKQQPTSFANVLSTTQSLQAGASTSAISNSSMFGICRPESPLPHITQPTTHSRHRQSPVSLLDFDSNHSRSQMNLSRPRNLVNGDNNTTPGMSGTAGDLHDSSSTTIDIVASATGPVLESRQSSQQCPGSKLFTVPPASSVITDVCSSSSNHRKSKKHKKEKKRSKQSEDAAPPTSLVPLSTTKQQPLGANQGTESFLNQYAGDIQSIGDEVLHNIGGDGAAFPPHDSLSSSSMSRFPSNISTNTMSMQNSARLLVNNEAETQNREGSDLTFAGKFKSTNNNAGVAIISESVTQSSTLKKSYSDSKDSSDVVVVESRSCSPFTTAQMGPDDSCSSSSRATIAAETLNLIADSNQEAPIDTKNASLQRLAQQGVVQPDHGLNSNSSLLTGTVSLVPAASEQQPLESVLKPLPKKRGRKKGSRGYDAVIARTNAFLNASMFERPRLLMGNKKVKTTKELLADIQSRKLGSSATSSPTLATSRQSVSPSTCSEASFQSDLTNTRASLLNFRSSPDAGISTNCRQSDNEENNSGSDSIDAVITAKSAKLPEASKLSAPMSSVDEYLNRLLRELPSVDFTKMKFYTNDEILCTCTVREVEPHVEAPKEQVVIIKSDDEDCMLDKSHIPLDVCKMWPKLEVPDKKAIVANGPVIEASSSLAPISHKSPKKPIKSIFDLDYDEENDPLYSFVEAAKLRLNDNAKGDATGHDQKPDSNNLAATDSENKLPPGVDKSTRSNSNQALPVGSHTFQKPLVLPTPESKMPNSGLFDRSAASELMPPSLPLYEVVEDPNCMAKYRYEVQTNCITEHHIKFLHNCYVGNVNGCWSAPIPILSEHRKRIRKYSQTQARQVIQSAEGFSPVKSNSWWTDDAMFQNTLDIDPGSDPEDEQYERVVPQYNHIVMDKIVKDLSQVTFTRNYMKKKLKRLKIQMKKELTETPYPPSSSKLNESNSLHGVSESRKVKKRKRTRTSSADENSDTNEDASDKKHKHQRRRKHKKLRDSNLETSTHLDININSNDLKDDGGQSNNATIDRADNQVNAVQELLPAENCKPNRISESQAGDTLQVPALSFHQSFELKILPDLQSTNPAGNFLNLGDEMVDIPLAKSLAPGLDECSNRNWDLAQKTDDHSRKRQAVEAEIIESSSNNSSNSCTSNINDIGSDKTEAKNVLTSVAPPAFGEEDSNSHDYSYCSGDVHKDAEIGGAHEDAEEDADYHAYDDEDEYDEDHNDGGEHEVVTHDMTSSTSTTSQQHIVLTIKKKILKPAPSHAKVDGNENGSFSPFRLSSVFDQDDDQLSIVTSSSTPTMIKIRRKNKQQKQPIPDEYPTLKQEDEPVALLDSIDMLDNNNVQNGLDVALAPNADMAEGSVNRLVESSVLYDGEVVDRVPGDLNGGKSSEIVNDARLENTQGNADTEGLSNSPRQCSPELVAGSNPGTPRPILESETNADGCALPESVAPKGEQPDLCDQDSVVDDGEPELSKDNNGLLASFNKFTDDNFSGLRILPGKQLSGSTIRSKVGLPAASESAIPSNNSGDDSATLNGQYLVQEFKEWHEVMQIPSYNDELLTILPYVVID